MKKAFISVSLKNKENLRNEINSILSVLKKNSIEGFVFVDKYVFAKNEAKRMMDRAFEEIRSSDILIVELTDKAVGVGVEVGFAKALNIPIVYLRDKHAEYSTTVGGSATEEITYETVNDLEVKLESVLK